MIEFYAEIRLVHIWSVIASGMIFFLRGLALLAGQGKAPGRIAMSMPVKLTSYTVDTVLLTAALMLMTVVVVMVWVGLVCLERKMEYDVRRSLVGWERCIGERDLCICLLLWSV